MFLVIGIIVGFRLTLDFGIVNLEFFNFVCRKVSRCWCMHKNCFDFTR